MIELALSALNILLLEFDFLNLSFTIEFKFFKDVILIGVNFEI